jgi:hypothetical protein
VGKIDRYLAKDGQAKITEYIDRMVNRYSRAVVVRVDLYYLSVTQVRLRVEEAFADQTTLARRIESNSVFDPLTGYICSVEYPIALSEHWVVESQVQVINQQIDMDSQYDDIFKVSFASQD